MNVLLVGSGGREHALAWKLGQSRDLTRLVCAPGNPGIAMICETRPVAVSDVEGLVALAGEIRADLVVVGPEAPLGAGLADRLAEAGIAVFGPRREAARLETSKAFMKAFVARHGIASAGCVLAQSHDDLAAALDRFSPPYVLKADGLAAGKGVVIAPDLQTALTEGDAMLSGRFGEAGRTLLIEEFMEGEEASLFALVDGRDFVIFGDAQDHKRALDGDLGPNTGGMGAYAPAPVLTAKARERAIADIIAPAVAGMASEGRPYVGVLFAGLMIKDERPRLVEFNARFGDPECQTLMMRLDCDLLPYLHAAARGDLTALPPPRWRPGASICVVLAAEGYPDAPTLDGEIIGAEADFGEDVVIFQAGVRRDEAGRLRAAGGRVLNACAYAPTLAEARARAMAALGEVRLAGGRYRRDIGWRALDERPAEFSSS